MIQDISILHKINLVRIYEYEINSNFLFHKEELAILSKKVERAKKIEQASSADEVLMEEIREYKVQVFPCLFPSIFTFTEMR